MNTSIPHIVIVGAGFGGVYTAQKLVPFVRSGKIRVTIISKTNYFLFTPLLHEVTTGGLGTHTVTESIREIFQGTGVHFIQGFVDSINTDKNQIIIGNESLSYDYLVISTGAGAEMRHAMGIAVFSGMLGVTFFGLFLTPVFYVLLRTMAHNKLTSASTPALHSQEHNDE